MAAAQVRHLDRLETGLLALTIPAGAGAVEAVAIALLNQAAAVVRAWSSSNTLTQ
jgi:hypothetical protein